MKLLLTTPTRRGELLTELRDASLTYPEHEHGATARQLPPDASHLDLDIPIGRGRRVFARAAEAVLGWQMHRGAGLDVRATTSRAEPGTLVLITFVRGLPVGLSAPCRVLGVVDEPDRRGFIYGTLPGHLESGEERFEVIRDEDEVVRLRLVAFSRHTPGPARWLGPLTSYGQRIVTGRYVAAVRRAAAGR
jgi:uncharacterized protein (UPF0548 family)